MRLEKIRFCGTDSSAIANFRGLTGMALKGWTFWPDELAKIPLNSSGDGASIASEFRHWRNGLKSVGAGLLLLLDGFNPRASCECVNETEFNATADCNCGRSALRSGHAFSTLALHL